MSFKTALIGASALAFAAVIAAPAAQAQSKTTLYGGGGTLAAKLYRDVFNCYSTSTYGILASSPGNPANVTYPTGVNSACATPANKSVALAYEPVGSGRAFPRSPRANPPTSARRRPPTRLPSTTPMPRSPRPARLILKSNSPAATPI
jgi:hypothetical protein